MSHAISEGDGISVLVDVDDAEAARAAESQGAEGVVVVRRLAEGVRASTRLPILLYAVDPDAAERRGRDRASSRAADDESWLAETIEHARRAWAGERREGRGRGGAGARARARRPGDPAALGGDEPDGEAPLERLLDLLPDVPAGKLAIAELPHPTRDDVAELERAGVDAVLVGAGDVGGLVDEPPPEV